MRQLVEKAMKDGAVDFLPRVSDRTLDIVRSYASTDSRIRISVNERNLGDYRNRNRAASLARGRFLKYHDSDDVMYPHCLAAMAAPLDAEPRAALAMSANHHWIGGPCPMLLTPRLAFEREYLGSGLFQLGPAAAMFRTEAFQALGGFPDAGVASDFLFWLHACLTVNVLLVPGDLFYYRIHAAQELSNPRNAEQYARARGEAWKVLNGGSCPLDPADLDRAKRNFVWTGVRDAYRKARQGQWRDAAGVVRFMGLDAGEWIRYLRLPHRFPSAGTPARE